MRPQTPWDARPVIAVDYDGVLVVHGELVPGALEFLADLEAHGYEAVIHTTRAEKPDQAFWVKQSLDAHGYDGPPLRITDRKVRAHLYLDDRAVPFDGLLWPTIPLLRDFEPWWNR